MTRYRGLALVVAILAAFMLFGGGAGVVSGLFGPRVMLNASGQVGQHGQTTPTSSGEQAAAPALQISGVAGAAARVFTSLSVEPAAKEARGYAIEARLVGKDGKPLADTEIAFYDVVELLGPREMLIGAAKTDGFGTAAIDYLPAEGGTHTIAARPTQWDRLAATQATATIQAARVAPTTYAHEQLPLDSFSTRVPYVGAFVLLAIWALFAFVVLGSAYRIPRGAHRTPYIGRARESRR
ncbi:MAG: hypothetical protein Q7S41_01365 [Candidatus Limnocylindria bacterium]|nr:hypothetical protein [Candidatus Limnocylindria bacterium]